MKKALYIGCCPEDLDLPRRFDLVARAGFQGIELDVAEHNLLWFDMTSRQLREVRSLADQHGLGITDLFCEDLWAHPITDNDETIRQRTIGRLKRTIEMAVELGVDTCLLVPGQVNPEHGYRTVWDRSIQVLHEDLLPHCERHHVHLAIETVWNRFLLSPIEFGHYLDQIGHPNVGVYLDCANVMPWSYAWDWVQELGPRITRVHLSGTRLWIYEHNDKNIVNTPGFNPLAWVNLLESDFDWGRILVPLREAGYDGWLTIDRTAYGKYYGEKPVFLMSRELDTVLEQCFSERTSKQ